MDVRSWLLKSVETPGASRKMRQMEMEFRMVGVVKEQKTAVASLTDKKDKKESLEHIKETNKKSTSSQ